MPEDRAIKYCERVHEALRPAMTAAVKSWYRTQTERLGVTREEIDDAVRRGWTGDMIAKLSAEYAEDLLGVPWDIEHLEHRIGIGTAEVKPVRIGSEDDRRGIENSHRGQ